MTSSKDKPGPTKKTDAKHVDDLLDEALADSFPASDPVGIDMTEPKKGPARPERKGR